MKIEVLYFSGCPHHPPAVARAKEALRAQGLPTDVAEIEVPDAEAAQRLKFLGSPSIRVNGQDVEPAARSRTAFGLMCRTYTEGRCQTGLPSQALIDSALQQARAGLPELQNPADTGIRRSFIFGLSLIAAVAASLCCILPIVAAVTGVGAIAAGVAFVRWRPYLLGVTGLLLAGGLWLAWRDHRKACAPGSLCATRPMHRWNRIALGLLAAGVVASAAFPYYSGAVARLLIHAPGPVSVRTAGFSTVAFQVPDMDCAACAVALSAAFRQQPGVINAKLDVNSRQAVVTFDPGAQNVAGLQTVITTAGFHIEGKPHSLVRAVGLADSTTKETTTLQASRI